MRIGAHTNTIENTWRHLKTPQSLQPDGRLRHLAHNMLAVGCPPDVDHLTYFIGIVASIDWNVTPPPSIGRRHVTRRRPIPHFKLTVTRNR